MSVIIVPVSGGVESTALLHKALRVGDEVTPIYIAVNGEPEYSVFDLTAAERIVKWFKDHEKEYKGRIMPLVYMVHPTFFHLANMNKIKDTPASYPVTQQFNLIYNLSLFRAKHWDVNPSIWIGWLKEDASEYSFNEFDFSFAEYQELLNLPVSIGKLSNIDRTCKPFRAPFWDMSKSEVYRTLPDQLKELVVPNGMEVWSYHGDVSKKPYESKKQEWESASIPVKEKYLFKAEEISRVGRYVGKRLKAADVGLSGNYDQFVSLYYSTKAYHQFPFTDKDFDRITDRYLVMSLVREAQHNLPILKSTTSE